MPDPDPHPASSTDAPPDASRPTRRTLLLMRHAKAESGHGDDHARRLNAKGHRQAVAVGEFLAEQGLRAQSAVHSSAARTTETLDLVRDHGGLSDRSTPVASDDIYLGGTDDMLATIIGAHEDVEVLLLVGHEPTVSRTAAALADEDASDPGAAASVRVGLPTGGLAILRLPEGRSWSDVRRGALVLEAVVRP